MKTAFTVFCAALALTGCARFNSFSYGSWLDEVGRPKPTNVRLTPEQFATYRAEADRLGAEAEAIRVKLASETNRVRRIEYLQELRDIGDRQAPVQEILHFGLVPPALPTPEPGNAGG